MLTELRISNIVLIDKLNLSFGSGLNVLTGETGAGKSILLDALTLALGGRSDVGLIRHGCDNASVVACFDTNSPELQRLLQDNGIESDENIILRRTLSIDGKSRAWINDTPVSLKVLKLIGDELVEIQGQFANHALLNPIMHRIALDNFARLKQNDFDDLLCGIRTCYHKYHDAMVKIHELQQTLLRANDEREYLEHNVSELKSLNVRIGEEAELAELRTNMMNAEKDASVLNQANELLGHGGNGLESQIFAVAHTLQKIKTDPNPYSKQIDMLYSAAELIANVSGDLSPIDVDTDTLQSIEERLFALRAVARKHRISVDELPEKLNQMENQLNIIDNSDLELKKINTIMENAKKEYDALAEKLTIARKNAGNLLREKILKELPDLKLDKADFSVDLQKADATQYGQDEVVFMIKTNPGMPFSPLQKSASGGELSRLMLAMRVVLGEKQNEHTFVFDEIDTGISGATASAVGNRLKRLASSGQALVITHSAQVAGYADKHFKISKTTANDTTTTNVIEITDDDRLNEIARIISGAEITSESLSMAKTLIKK